MRAAFVVTAGFLLAVIAVYVAGAMLPRNHVATVTREVRAHQDTLATLVENVRGYPAWRSGVTEIDSVAMDGTMTRFTEVAGSDRVSYALSVVSPGEQYRSEITDESLPWGGAWTISLTPADAGNTLVTIEERGFVRNPIIRAIAKYAIGHTKTMNTYLDDLNRAAAGPMQ